MSKRLSGVTAPNFNIFV